MGEDGDGRPDDLQALHDRARTPPSRPIAVRVPEPLLEDLDDLWEGEYESRSAFVRSVLHYVAANPETVADARGAGADRR